MSQKHVIRNKLGLLELASYLKNVSGACKVMCYSRDTFYRVKHAYESGGEEALLAVNRRKPNVKNRVDELTEEAVLSFALEKADEHDYQLFLALNDIDHTKTKAKSPQTNGICERFNKTILEEFYMLAFRKKIYNSVDELQTDLDRWLVYYNESRPHQGKRQHGRTPMETFMDNLSYALGKNHAKFAEEFAVGDDLTVTI